MSILSISEFPNQTGELRWQVSLLDQKDDTIFQSLTPLAKAGASAVAKALKFLGPKATFLGAKPEDPSQDGWIVSEMGGETHLALLSITDTAFRLLQKPADDDQLKLILESVAACLDDATIAWNPPSADPAEIEKEQDETETQGISGS